MSRFSGLLPRKTSGPDVESLVNLPSITSPTLVPVPWHSTYAVSENPMPALAYAFRMTASCPSALGSVIPLVFPLLPIILVLTYHQGETQFIRKKPHALIAVARITDRIASPSWIASSSLLRYSAPIPSALPYPSAEESNVWQVDVPESTPAFIVPRCCSGDCIKLAPATTAPSHSPLSSAVHAICRQ